MVQIAPFKAVRPTADIVQLLAARSYVSYSKKELAAKLNYNPFSFIHIINPEYNSPQKSRPNSKARFLKVRARYEEFLQQGYLFREDRRAFYVYRQKDEHGYEFSGVMAAVSVNDYENGIIRKHEETLKKRERILEKYLDVTHINAEPVLLTQPDDLHVESFLSGFIKTRPVYDFTTTDKVRHTVWVLDDREACDFLTDRFRQHGETFIADGHHRAASSALLYKDLQKKGVDHTSAGYFMAFFIPQRRMKIYPFHRLIGKLPMPAGQLCRKIAGEFRIEESSDKVSDVPRSPDVMYMVTKEKSYAIRRQNSEGPGDGAASRPIVTALGEQILEPLLGITDQRRDKNVFFEGGPDGCRAAIEKIKNGKADLAFILPAVTHEQFAAVSRSEMNFPPKSTWIEPKLRSGLIMYDF